MPIPFAFGMAKFMAKAGANAQTPCFIGHGTDDNVVLPECGERSAKALEEAGVKEVSYSTYRMAHLLASSGDGRAREVGQREAQAELN